MHFQPYPMYHVTTNWQQVVPKLNSRGRDLLLVSSSCVYLFSLSVGPGELGRAFKLTGRVVVSGDGGHCQAPTLAVQKFPVLMHNFRLGHGNPVKFSLFKSTK